MSHEVIDYNPPDTINEFIKDHISGGLFYSWIIGPYGSGKSTGNFMKLVHMAKLQKPGPDGMRRTRCVVVRNTGTQLSDTTLKSWNLWFKDGQAGRWIATQKTFILKYDDVVCEVMFRPLDTDDDINRVLSLEVTFAIIDEFIEIPRKIMEALAARCGRYPSAVMGGATNWGIWGASNPGTEDNWWWSYLHNQDENQLQEIVENIELFGAGDKVARIKAMLDQPWGIDMKNVRYYHQPPGDSEEAENTEYLPGKERYYTNLAVGKSPAWIEQYIRANWGFSDSETPVIKTFKPDIHIAKRPIRFSPLLPLVMGLDPGRGGTACVFGQEDLWGRLLVLGELTAQGMGIERFISDKLKPYLRRKFPGSRLIIAPDPAAGNKQQTDERAVVDVLRKAFPGTVKIETNNRLAIRLAAYESYTSRITEEGPALLIDKYECPMFVRALAGGWRYEKVKKSEDNKPDPEKNFYSHLGDAGGYLCRYFHKQFTKTGERGRQVEEIDYFHPVQTQQRVPIYHNR